MRLIAPVRRKPGSKSKIQKRRLQFWRLTEHFRARLAAVDVVGNLMVDEVAVGITRRLKPGGSLASHTAGRQSVARHQESSIHLDGIFFCEPHFYASTGRKFLCVTTVKFSQANDKICGLRKN